MKSPINAGNHRRRRPDVDEGEITVKRGQVAFRMLCHVDTAGGVIGSHGAVVKELEGDTGTKIRFEPTLSGCLERVIDIIGYSEIDRKIVWEGEGGRTEECEISEAQDALFRVFERVLEVEESEASVGVIGCRLLANKGQIGALMGVRGSVVDQIRKSTGAKIKVLPKDQLPDCASPSEELIQIMGGVFAVKRALLAVSHRLQLQSPVERELLDSSSHALSCYPPAEVLPSRNHSSPPLPAQSVDYDTDLSMSRDIGKKLSLDEDFTKLKVAYRLLCPANVVGGVIGKRGTVIRALERETGASINMSAPLAQSTERTATISAVENLQPLFSPAQTALIGVFTKCIDCGIEQRKLSELNSGENVTARLLVASSEVFCLIKEGRVAPDIASSNNVEIRVFGEDLVPRFAGPKDRVVQITGDYEKVKSALFQVTGQLRDNLLTIANGRAEPRKALYPAKLQSTQAMHVSDISGQATSQSRVATFGDGLQSTQAIDVSDVSDHTKSESSLTSFGDGPEFKSVEPAGAGSITLEVMVPHEFFDSIYGEDGSNLARMKQISGATITVDEPYPGENEGKVTITGTADQAQRAKSLLHAFTLTVPSPDL